MNLNRKMFLICLIVSFSLASMPRISHAFNFFESFDRFANGTVNTAAAGYTIIFDGQLKDVARRVNCKIDEILGRKNGYLFCSYL